MRSIYDEIKSHWGNPAESGEDIHNISIPSGFKYTSARIDEAPGNVGGLWWIESEPQRGSTGAQRIKVHWSHLPFCKARYRLRAYTSEVEVEEEILTIDMLRTHNWRDLVMEAIDQKKHINLVVRGDLATEMKEALRSNQQAVTKSALGWVAVIAIISVTVGFVLIYAIENGCNAEAKGAGEVNLGGVEDLLYFDIKCQNS